MANNAERVSTKYGEARFIIMLVDVVGGLLFIAGLLWFGWSVLSFANALSSDNGGAGLVSLLGLGPSFGTMVAGLLIIAHGQLVRATLDAADCTRELLLLERERSDREAARRA